MSLTDIWKEHPFTLIGPGNGICVQCGNPAQLLGSYLFDLCDSCIGGPSLISTRKHVKKNPQVSLEAWL